MHVGRQAGQGGWAYGRPWWGAGVEKVWSQTRKRAQDRCLVVAHIIEHAADRFTQGCMLRAPRDHAPSKSNKPTMSASGRCGTHPPSFGSSAYSEEIGRDECIVSPIGAIGASVPCAIGLPHSLVKQQAGRGQRILNVSSSRQRHVKPIGQEEKLAGETLGSVAKLSGSARRACSVSHRALSRAT